MRSSTRCLIPLVVGLLVIVVASTLFHLSQIGKYGTVLDDAWTTSLYGAPDANASALSLTPVEPVSTDAASEDLVLTPASEEIKLTADVSAPSSSHKEGEEKENDRVNPPLNFSREYRAMEIDQDCFRRGQGYLHFLHMRKAGGTTIRMALSTSSRLFISEGFTFNVSCLAEAGSMVHLTNLRDPVSRIVSQFYYEGQYTDIHDPIRRRFRTTMDEFGGHEPNTPGRPEDMQGLFNETMTFPEYLQQNLNKYDSDPEVYRRNRMWEGVDNYYIKTLTNRYRVDTRKPIDETDLALAKEILSQFDVILIMEWLNDPEMVQHFESVLGMKGTAFHRENSAKQDSTRKKHIDESTIKHLKELNHFDCELYEWAKKLTKSRMEATKRRQLEQLQQQEQQPKDQGGTEIGDDAAFDVTLCRPLPPIPQQTVHGIAYADLCAYPDRHQYHSNPAVCNYPFYNEGEKEDQATKERSLRIRNSNCTDDTTREIKAT